MSAGSLVHTHTKEIQNFVVFFFFQFIILPYAANSFLLNFALSAAYFISKSMFDELPPEKKKCFQRMAPGWQNKENRARCHIYHLLFLKKKKILCRRTHSFASDTASLMTFTILLPAPEKHYRVEGGLCDPRHTVVHRVIRPRPFGCFLATRRFSFSVSKSCTCTHC